MTGVLLCPTCATPAPIERTPRLEELLHHNLPPLESEIPEYEFIFKEASALVTELNARIEKVREILNNLIRARNDAQKLADDAKAVLHPVRSLPSEILFEIFSHRVATWHNPDPDRRRRWDSLHPGFPPWSLSHVCQRWRAEVLSSPQLWSYLELQFQTHKRHISQSQCATKVSLWLDRCADFPISLWLVSRTISLDTHPVLPVLCESMKLWARVSISMPTPAIQCFSGNPLPLLRVLDANAYVKTENDVPVDVFSGAQNLRTFEWCVAGTELLQHLVIPSVQLTSAVFDHNFHERSVPPLRLMTNLNTLELTAYELNDEVEGGTIFLPELTRLCLIEGIAAEAGALKALFGRLCIPNLTMLELRFPQNVDRIIYFPVFRTPPERLTGLYLASAMATHPSNTDNLLQFLSLIPSVTRLQIYDHALTAKFMTEMMVLDGQAFALLPCLREFDMDECWKQRDLSYETIWDMLESRCLPASITELTSSSMERRCRVETLWVPRWLYRRTDERWRNICGSLEVFCGSTMKDIDDCIDYYSS